MLSTLLSVASQVNLQLLQLLFFRNECLLTIVIPERRWGSMYAPRLRMKKYVCLSVDTILTQPTRINIALVDMRLNDYLIVSLDGFYHLLGYLMLRFWKKLAWMP
jgi:hypothetical protein